MQEAAQTHFVVDQAVICTNIKPLEGNTIAPPLELNSQYTIKGIQLDSQGNQHLDVGLVSEVEYVRSFETKEQLKDGHEIHWCHPLAFS